jgi:hypothetical protein
MSAISTWAPSAASRRATAPANTHRPTGHQRALVPKLHAPTLCHRPDSQRQWPVPRAAAAGKNAHHSQADPHPGQANTHGPSRGPEGRSLDLRRIAGITPDLGVWLPLLSVGDPRLPIVRGPSAAQARARGGHGRRARRSSEPAGDGRQLGRRVRPVHGPHEPRWQVSRRERGSSALSSEGSPDAGTPVADEHGQPDGELG